MLKGAPLFDDQSNIYLATVDMVYKFSPAGEILWQYWPSVQVPRWNGMTNSPSLHRGAVFGTTVNGYAWSASMETGKELWLRKVYEGLPDKPQNAVGGDTGNIDVHDGVFVSAGEIWKKDVVAGNVRVTALNSTDGALLWDFKVDSGIWNFAAHFQPAGSHGAEEATVLFQDVRGAVYRLGLHSGKLIWKSEGGSERCWTDGSMNVGPNGLAYSVTVDGDPYRGSSGPDQPGFIFATNLSTGGLAWKAAVSRPPNSMPVLMPSEHRGGKLSLVLPIGQQAGDPPGWRDMLTSWDFNDRTTSNWRAWFMHKLSLLLGDRSLDWLWTYLRPLPNDIVSLDAETGQMNWRWQGPVYRRPAAAGDEEGLLDRIQERKMFACLPCPWGFPAADAAGTLYVGNQDGKLYALRESGTEGGLDVVSAYDMEACFLCGSGGVTFAPGLMAVGTCDTLFVFKT